MYRIATIKDIEIFLALHYRYQIDWIVPENEKKVSLL